MRRILDHRMAEELDLRPNQTAFLTEPCEVREELPEVNVESLEDDVPRPWQSRRPS